MDKLDGFFLHGGDYKGVTGIPRDRCCETCAFKKGEGTVRPEGVTIADVWAEVEGCYDFVCHTPEADGRYPSCPGFFALASQKKGDGRG